jgi:hypothetical protein
MRHTKRIQAHTYTQTHTHTNTHKAHAHITHHSPGVVRATKEKRKNGNHYKIGSARKICPKRSNRDKRGAIKQRQAGRRRWLCVCVWGGCGWVRARSQIWFHSIYMQLTCDLVELEVGSYDEKQWLWWNRKWDVPHTVFFQRLLCSYVIVYVGYILY